MISKKIILSIAIVGIVGLAAVVAKPVQAQDPSKNPLSGLVEAIAQKFSLDKTKVQVVVDDFEKKRRADMQKMMEQRMKTKFDALVKQGKITSQQESAILAKLKELKGKNNPETFKNMTPQERQKAMQDKKTQLEQWAKSQGIDPQYLMFGHGPGMMMMKRG
jgi:Flp pilus assembly protein CpaB